MIELCLVGCKVAPNNFSSAQRVFTNFQKAAACPHNSRRIFLRHFGGELQEGSEYSVLESSCLQHWFKNWKELRKNKLTASTLLGLLVSGLEGEFNSGKRRLVQLSHFLETWPPFGVYLNNNLNDNDDNWLGCSPDGVVDNAVYGLPYRGVLEIKCPYYDGDKQKSHPWSRILLHCIPQAQGYSPGKGLIPASFKVRSVPLDGSNGAFEEVSDPDFGESAIGCVAPVDSGLWWIILLRAYGKITGDHGLQERVDVQTGIKLILNLCLAAGFDIFPSLLVTDGSCIDRPMDGYTQSSPQDS
ncbi:hypothetical protein IFM89_013087, partial [Coptis chinensis]